MGLFDGFQFDPQSFDGGGLLAQLRSQIQGQNQPSPLDNAQWPAGPQGNYGQTQNVDVGGYQMPQFGTAPQPDPAAIPQNAQLAQLTPQQAQQPPMQPDGPGLTDRFGAGLAGFGAGGRTGGLIGALGGAATGFSSGVTPENQTVKALVARGLDPDLAQTVARNPALLQGVVSQMFSAKSGVNINNRLVDPRTGKVIADFSDTKAPETKEVETPGGGKVTLQWNQNSKAWEPIPGVPTGGAGKPPAGYQYVDQNDPSKGLQAIPGGPATHLPSETAGRVAMMETAAADLPSARKILMDGRSGTGAPLSSMAASTLNVGDTARANRTVRVAIEGALRAMTGAAAPEQEVKRYENMFMPSPLDSRETATQKLNLLDDFISNAKNLVTQGRGPAGNAAPGRKSDPLGIR